MSFSKLKNTKSRFKYEVCRRKRRHRHLVRSKLASTFFNIRSNNFCSVVHSLNKSRSKNNRVPIVDSVSGESDIANLFASKLSSRLNTHPGLSADDLHSFDTSLLEYQLSEVKVSTDDVLSAIESLKPGKTDSDRVSSYHLKYAVPVIVESIASFFTAILHHGYMPKYFRDCVVIPIPKSCHDLSSSDNYRPISLASCLSKVLERIVLNQYSSFFISHPLQFGFKSGSSTSLCTGTVKCIVRTFLGYNKAFDLVDHHKLFGILKKRGLPILILHFLCSWYCKQEMKVQWGSCLSRGFIVSIGVRQGGVLSPYLFAVYLDGLLEELSNSGVGCYWGSSFVGVLAYADDIVL